MHLTFHSTETMRRCAIVPLGVFKIKIMLKSCQFQAVMAMELRSQGASHNLFASLNNLGASLGVNASRLYVDTLAKEHDKQLMKWKADIQVLFGFVIIAISKSSVIVFTLLLCEFARAKS